MASLQLSEPKVALITGIVLDFHTNSNNLMTSIFSKALALELEQLQLYILLNWAII